MNAKSRSRSSSASTESTLDDLKALLAEAETALASAAEKPAEEIHALRERLRSAIDEGKATARHAMEVAREQASRADEAVRAHPYAAIGVAAGVGLLAGLVLGRQTR